MALHSIGSSVDMPSEGPGSKMFEVDRKDWSERGRPLPLCLDVWGWVEPCEEF